MTLKMQKCDFCRHFHMDNRERSCCDAFPEGIPINKMFEDEEKECNNGIKYEKE